MFDVSNMSQVSDVFDVRDVGHMSDVRNVSHMSHMSDVSQMGRVSNRRRGEQTTAFQNFKNIREWVNHFRPFTLPQCKPGTRCGGTCWNRFPDVSAA
ncbi:MAG: hypothetical protein QOF78_4434 [Phycisphaerales bacterium]|nr:hypothetical protein [Phycisphaerales bacterium]